MCLTNKKYHGFSFMFQNIKMKLIMQGFTKCANVAHTVLSFITFIFDWIEMLVKENISINQTPGI